MDQKFKDSLGKAFCWMLLSSFSFALMNTLIRVLADSFSAMESAVIRSGLGAVVLVVILLYQGESILGHLKKELNNRGLLGAAANTFYFYALSGGNLAEIVSLIRTSALMIPFIALWSLSEKFKLRHYLCSVAGFMGTLLVIKPSYLEFSYYSVAAIFCAIFTAFAWTSVRVLAHREHPATITLYLYSYATVAAVITMIVFKIPFVSPSWLDWFYLCLLVAVGLSAQFSLVNAYRHAPAAVVSPINYSEIVFAAILGWIVFGQESGFISFVGILTIILSATLIQNPVEAFRKWKRGALVESSDDKNFILPE